MILPRFTAAVDEALADQRLDTSETVRLDQLARELRLTDATVRRVLNQRVAAIVEPAFHKMLEDHRISPQEFADFAELSKGLNVQPSFDAATQEVLRRYALFWRIENGDLPSVEVPIALQKGEDCHFCCQARWLELRKQSRTVGYYSHGMSFRIARGVYYRVGQSRPQRVTSEGLTEIDSGVLYLTSKRVLFDGLRRNSSIRLSSLIAFEPYSDGLMLEKSSGRSPYLIFDGDAELAAVLLGALLRQ